MSQGRDFPRGAICRFLNNVTDMALRPLPIDLVAGAGLIEPLPPVQVGFTTKVAFHRLDYVARISVQNHPTGFLQRLKTERGGGNFSLLISCFSQIGTKGTPQSLIAKQRHRRRARRITAIPETRAVTKDRDEFGGPAVLLVVSQGFSKVRDGQFRVGRMMQRA